MFHCIVITAIQDPKIKFQFVSNYASNGDLAPLYFAYRLKSQLLPLILSEITDEHLFHPLDVAVAEDIDGMEYAESVLNRMASDDEKNAMLRRVNQCGVTMFAQAVWTQKRKLKKSEIIRYFLDNVMKTDDDNVYYLTTASLQDGTNPLREFVDNPVTMDLFTECMNERLTPLQRIEQLVFKSYEGTTILSLSNDMTFRLRLAEIIETALNAIETPIEDFDTLWALFTFCFNNLTDAKFLVRLYQSNIISS